MSPYSCSCNLRYFFSLNKLAVINGNEDVFDFSVELGVLNLNYYILRFVHILTCETMTLFDHYQYSMQNHQL